jgi:DNA polymerase III alpha subunit (gram-positive type)
MYNQRNFIVYDLETSGLNPEKGAEIVQIAAKSLKYSDYSLHENGTFEILIKPQHPEKASPQAIDVIGDDLWESAKQKGVHPKTGLRKFFNFIESLNWSGKHWSSPIRVGYNNISFDDRFLEYWMKEYGLLGKKQDDQPWSNISLDVYTMLFSLFGRDNLKNNKLDTFADMFGMARASNTHDAMEDVNITSNIFQRYMKFANTQMRPKLRIKNEQITA